MLEVYDELRLGPSKLGLTHEINVALPTEREIAQFWWKSRIPFSAPH